MARRPDGRTRTDRLWRTIGWVGVVGLGRRRRNTLKSQSRANNSQVTGDDVCAAAADDQTILPDRQTKVAFINV